MVDISNYLLWFINQQTSLGWHHLVQHPNGDNPRQIVMVTTGLSMLNYEVRTKTMVVQMDTHTHHIGHFEY
jgi:hypothetical protein